MSWSKSVLAACVLGLSLSGCGFQPMYAKRNGESSPLAAEMAGVRVAGIEDRNGQILRNYLVQIISPHGEPATAQYTLAVVLNETQQGLAEQKDGKTSLGNLLMSATFTLTPVDESGGYTGHARSVVSYRYLGPRYGTVAAERDAQERALSDLAANISAQIGAYFAGGKRSNLRTQQ